jgi:uncharacterized protein YjgD (DUF1641 family)
MTASTTSSIEARLERIEKSLEKISTGLEQAPAMLSMAADSFDEIVGNAKAEGVYLEDRLRDGLHLLRRLSDPAINKSLHGLLDTVEQAPGLVSMVVDMADETAGKSNEGPIKLTDRIEGLSGMLSKLSHPDTIQNIEKLLLLSEQAPGLIAMLTDTLDDILQDNVLTDFETIGTFVKGLESVQDSLDKPLTKVGGFLGFNRLIKDEDRQRALGFMMTILKNYGKKIKFEEND